ncbi:MAG: hypothetical protein ACM3NH_02085 [Candidatus Saccharibacteria bacterium]
MAITDPMNASISEFAKLSKDSTIRDVQVLKDMPGALWVKFDCSGARRCRYFDDTPENRRVLESLERAERMPVFPLPRPAIA